MTLWFTVPGPVWVLVISAGGAAWGYLAGSAIYAKRRNPELGVKEFLLEVKK